MQAKYGTDSVHAIKRPAPTLGKDKDMMNTDDLRHYTGIGTGYSPEMMMQRAADEMDNLRALVVACRGSVKFDLLHYEKMARAYGNLGPEGAQTHAVAEVEAQRLHDLLEKIDALALTTPNVKLRGAEPIGEASPRTQG